MGRVFELIILNVSKKEVASSYFFNRLFLRLGFIVPISDIIDKLTKAELLSHQGNFENDESLFENLKTTEKGKDFFQAEISKIEIPAKDFDDDQLIILKRYLGL